VVVGVGPQTGITYVLPPHLHCIILNHWLLVYSCLLRRFYSHTLSTMVAIRRAPGPPPRFNSEDSDSSATATSSSKAKPLHPVPHSPEQPSPLANGKSREDSHDTLREDGSRDTVSHSCKNGCTLLGSPIPSSVGSSSNEEEQRRTKRQEWGEGASLGTLSWSISP
jgi:hypothetical protein